VIERELSRLILQAVEAAAPELGLEEIPGTVEVVRPRQKEHGDYATNVALALGASTGRNPREVAEVVLRHMPPNDVVAKAEVAGPGFVNLFLAHGWLYRVLGDVERMGDEFGRSDAGEAETVQVEFVSANPTGPLHVGSGRNAAIGDSLARVLEAAGHRVEREYYVNDAGTQAELFAASVEARYLQHLGKGGELPTSGYEGAYLKEVAARIADEEGDSLLGLPTEERRARLGDRGVQLMLSSIGSSLGRMDVRIDRWVHQSALLRDGLVDQAVRLLRERELAYEAEGALWFRAERFGDEKDRVLIRSNGEPTYFASDCAYLREKFARGYDRLVYVWGADHHGTVRRLQGAVQAMGYELDRVEFIVYQLVNLSRGGEPVRMSKRTGELITLDEVVDEVGPDAARYTLLSRSPDTTLDFDLEAVRRQTLDNPVYYVQYAHARIASILRYAEEQGVPMAPLERVRPEELVHETELDLLRKIAELPEQIELAAKLRAPYRMTRFAEELAAGFHRFYTECRVVTDDPSLTQARLHLAAATRQAIANVLALLGVSAPDSMARLEEGHP
jgi:arginyl-tRNA synthetase